MENKRREAKKLKTFPSVKAMEDYSKLFKESVENKEKDKETAYKNSPYYDPSNEDIGLIEAGRVLLDM